jgi:uncharacterized protein (DUF169 family)
VGVRLLHSPGECSGVPIYGGVSYCDAVRRAGLGEALRVIPGSVQVCRWTPVVLGLKEPQGRFEEGLKPRLAFPVAGLLLAPLDSFPGEPDVVLLRARPEILREMVATLGQNHLWAGHEGRLEQSANPILVAGQPNPRQGLIRGVNSLLAPLARLTPWQALTKRLFRSEIITASFEALISRTLADMSVCRNSTVIPLSTGRINTSFFCTGGITWGRNCPDHLTSGWPWRLYRQLPSHLAPGTGLPESQSPTCDPGSSR